LNFLYGKQADGQAATFRADVTCSYELSDAVSLGVNASCNETPEIGGFYGAAIYPAVVLSKDYQLGMRLEYFKKLATGGPVYGAETGTFDATLTASYFSGSLRLISEVRLDQCSTPQFTTMTDKTLASFVLAAVYTF